MDLLTLAMANALAKQYTDAQLEDLGMESITYHFCVSGEYNTTSGVPTVTNPDSNTFYFVPVVSGNGLFNVYIYKNNWVLFTSTELDLSNMPVDDSLSESGMAADAKKTGDELTAIKDDLNQKQDLLIFDSIPVSESNNPVKSGGVYTALGYKLDVPNIDGEAGDVLTNDGEGGASWSKLGQIQDANISVSGDKLIIADSGSVGTWTLVRDYTSELESVINITTDDDGNDLSLASARVLITFPSAVTKSTSWNMEAFSGSKKLGGAYSAAKTSSSITRLAFDVVQDHGYWDVSIRGTMSGENYVTIRVPLNDQYFFMKNKVSTYPYITRIASDTSLPAGVNVQVWTLK